MAESKAPLRVLEAALTAYAAEHIKLTDRALALVPVVAMAGLDVVRPEAGTVQRGQALGDGRCRSRIG